VTKPGDVVLVPFPYRDQLAESTRPAVVVSSAAYNQSGDLIVAGITSHPPRGPFDHALVDWQAAGLQFPSTVRMLLMTVAQSRVVRTIRQLSARDWAAVKVHLSQVIA
jgi:mRNA interferase MazF